MYSLVKYSVGSVESVLAACISLFRSIFFFSSAYMKYFLNTHYNKCRNIASQCWVCWVNTKPSEKWLFLKLDSYVYGKDITMITRKCWVLLSFTSTTINYFFKF